MANFPLGVITDEFSQDFELVCRTAKDLGLTRLEARTAWDKNIVDMSDAEIDEMRRLADAHGLKILSVASPVFKCTHPDGGEIDHRFEQDAFHSKHAFDDQSRILERALEIAGRLEAPIVRVFSFWRTVEPAQLRDAVIESLRGAVAAASSRGVKIGLENEHACNIATCEEAAPVLQAIPDPNLGLVWDPANAYFAGATAFPDDYRKIPADRVIHVHAKDGVMDRAADRMAWGDIGAGKVGWPDIFKALLADGYAGAVCLETHWQGPGGDKFQGSAICAKSLKRLIAEA